MSISWGPVAQVAPTLWARVGYDDKQGLHLINGDEDDIQKMEGLHYWKVSGLWYVQTTGTTYSDNEADIFGSDPIFAETNLDCDQMVRSITLAQN